MRAYLDNSATTRANDSVIQAMRSSLTDGYFNPSALYAPAVRAQADMDSCRQRIVDWMGGKGRVIFASGGTEANNLAILGTLSMMRGRGDVLYSAGEHPSVIEACKAAEKLGFTAKALPLHADGLLDMDRAGEMMGPDTALIALMQVNNETGAIQPLAKLSQLRQRLCPQALLHVDGVQAFMKLAAPHDVDSYSLSAHKLHGPKGIGALWMREGSRVAAQLFGGGQEQGLRSGTENTPGIAGLLAAIDSYPAAHSMRALKLRLLDKLQTGIPELHINGPDPAGPQAADHILSLSFPPVRAQTMLHALEAEGVLVGNGSACSSRRNKASHVLSAMGLQGDRLSSAIRFSLSVENTQEEIDHAADATIRCYNLLKHYRRR